MWVGGSSQNCTAVSSDWVAVSDPDFVDITTFTIDDAASFTQTLAGEAGTIITQRMRQIQMQIGGRLILDNSISRTIEDTIKVRNDLFL